MRRQLRSIGLIIFIGIVLIPFVYILLFSLFSYYKYPLLFPQNFTFRYWKGLFIENTLFYSSVANTVGIGLVVALSGTLIGQMTGRAIVRYMRPTNSFLPFIISIPLFIPAVPLLLGVHQVLLGTSLVNNWIGIVLAHVLICIPYTTNIAISYYKGIPIEMEQVVKTLGGNRWMILKKVLLPMMTPAITLSLSISFLISTTEYFSVFLIGGGNVISLSMLMYPFINNSEYGFASVTGLIFIAMNLMVFVLADKLIKKNTGQLVLYGMGD